MPDPLIILTIAGSSLAAIGMLTWAGLAGWRGWLDLKRAELVAVQRDATPPSAASRIEMADLKERLKKLEAIAAGVDI